MLRTCLIRSSAALALLTAAVTDTAPAQILAAAPQQQSAARQDQTTTPEQRMNRRFPQPVRVGDLIGLPMLDEKDSTLGYISAVVRTPDGKIVLVVPYRAWLGWAPFDWGRRAVGVPIEVVAILGRQVAALDMPRADFAAAPAFAAGQGTPLAPDETIRIALTRR